MKTMNSNTPIDLVIPWVDGADPDWLEEKKRWEQCDAEVGTRDRKWAGGDIRYRDWETLKYFFRGVEQFAPWVRTVFFVTWGHLPEWLNTAHPQLRIIRHEEYIPREFLPTFNSHTIELNLHRIDGLAEQFIYFNDDTFLTAPVKRSDFFQHGLPCDTAILNPVPMTRGVWHAEVNNIGILNDHFDKNRVIMKAPQKWFSPKYGRKGFRTCLLLPWRRFPGLYEQHLPVSFLKSTFETVWRMEEEELRTTCACKFRERGNVNQYLMKNWQIAEGKFVPRTMNIGKMYMYGEADNYDEVCAAVKSGKWKMLCINDSAEIDDFERRKEQLIQAFEQLLPMKSSFER